MLEAMLACKQKVAQYDSLLTMLTETSGLLTNASNEVYTTTNQQTTPGDGKRYDFLADPQGRLIKKISAQFRYTQNLGALSAFFFYWRPGTDWTTRLGMYDEWNNQTGFRLVSDIHAQALVTTSQNIRLERTFATPIPQTELSVKIGGRSGFTFASMFMKDLLIEYA